MSDQLKPIFWLNGITSTTKSKSSFLKSTTQVVLEDIGMIVYEKSSIAVMGESGSGKDHLAEIIIGRRKTDAGRLEFSKTLISSHETINHSDIVQIVPQDLNSAINFNFTILDIVTEGLKIKGSFDSSKSPKRARHILKGLDFDQSKLQVAPDSLSYLDLIKVVLSRALLLKPKIVVIEDVFSNLFFAEKDRLIKLLAGIQSDLGISFILLTNDMYAIRYLCNHALILYAGRMIEAGSIDKLFTQPKHPYTESLLWSACIKQDNRPDHYQGEVDSYLDCPTGCPFSARCRFAIPQCLSKLPPVTQLNADQVVRCIRQDQLHLTSIIASSKVD